MFFTEATPLTGGEAGPFTQPVRVDFTGTFRGSVRVALCPEAERHLAANFSGAEEDEILPEQAQEVAAELANMICGQVLSRWAPEGEFTLGSPSPVHIAEAPEEAGAVYRLRSRRQYALDSGSMQVEIEIQ
jgi:hypothetical protein